MTEILTRDRVVELLMAQSDDDVDWTNARMELIDRWIERGDGCAVYENVEIGHPQMGHLQFTSYGSPDAQIEASYPPRTMPDIGRAINWRYQLLGTWRDRNKIPV